MKFLRLIRITNLLIIIVTMVGVADYLLIMHNYQKANFNFLDYFLLVFSTVLIAAAGNMINDYFDIKADRVNKPDRLIVSKY
ncbi:MAG: UbiA family prenyltransferase, partial [Crocinitomicaceae bacterium]